MEQIAQACKNAQPARNSQPMMIQKSLILFEQSSSNNQNKANETDKKEPMSRFMGDDADNNSIQLMESSKSSTFTSNSSQSQSSDSFEEKLGDLPIMNKQNSKTNKNIGDDDDENIPRNLLSVPQIRVSDVDRCKITDINAPQIPISNALATLIHTDTDPNQSNQQRNSSNKAKDDKDNACSLAVPQKSKGDRRRGSLLVSLDQMGQDQNRQAFIDSLS